MWHQWAGEFADLLCCADSGQGGRELLGGQSGGGTDGDDHCQSPSSVSGCAVPHRGQKCGNSLVTHLAYSEGRGQMCLQSLATVVPRQFRIGMLVLKHYTFPTFAPAKMLHLFQSFKNIATAQAKKRMSL